MSFDITNRENGEIFLMGNILDVSILSFLVTEALLLPKSDFGQYIPPLVFHVVSLWPGTVIVNGFMCVATFCKMNLV